MADLTMPSLGADMDAGTLVRWRVSAGDVVERGDVVCEVETDKGVIEVQTFSAGQIRDLVVAPGTRVPVGVVLAHLDDVVMNAIASAAIAARAPSPAQAPAAATGSGSDASTVAGSSVIAGSDRVPPVTPSSAHILASPYARARARELGVDLAAVTGTARHGAIHVHDVERAALARAAQATALPSSPVASSPVASSPVPSSAVASTGAPTLAERTSALASPPVVAPAPRLDEAAARKARMRKAIAATVSRSKREIPHFYLATTADLAPALAWLAEENASRPVEARILSGALLLWAAAHAVRAVPELNARWADDHAETIPAVHLGVAISLRGGGLVAPAIFDAHRMDLAALMRALADVTQRARAGGLRSSEMAGATLSVTSLGERGAPTVFPVIFPPQVAMVGFGRVVERPWVVGGAVVPRSVVDISLAADHRVVDGHRASLYLEELVALLAHPETCLVAPEQQP